MIASLLLSPVPKSAALLAEFEWGSLVIPLIWLGVIILTLIVESQTADLVAIWFAPAALTAMILSFFDVVFWIQFSVFAALTLIGLVLSFTVIRPAMKKKEILLKTNTDALAGKLALVEEDIDNTAPSGVAKVNGQLWTARMNDPADKASKGEWVEIVRVEGSKLICRPKA